MKGTFQINGTSISMSTEAGNMEPTFKKKASYQASGDKLPLKEGVMTGFDGFSGGKRQNSGDAIQMSKTPMKSYEHSDVKMSERNSKQKQGY
jgi:hypothetical protein